MECVGVGDLQGTAGLALEGVEKLEWGGSAAQGTRTTLGEPLLEIPSSLQPRDRPSLWQACG